MTTLAAIANGGLQRGAALIIADAQTGYTAIGTGAGVLAVPLTSGLPYTQLSLAAGVPASGIAAGQPLTLINGSQTQQVVASGSVAAGINVIPVASFTANANYATGTGVVNTPQNTDTTLQNEGARQVTGNVVAGANPGEMLLSSYLSSVLGTAGTQYLEVGFFAGDATATANSGTLYARMLVWFLGGTSTTVQLDTTV